MKDLTLIGSISKDHPNLQLFFLGFWKSFHTKEEDFNLHIC
jgi:hypothetical protein